MELHFKNFPASDLPYNTIETATSVMVKLYENIPFLTLLPNIGGEVSLLEMTIQGFLCISKKEHKVILSESEERLCKEFNVMDAAFKKPEKTSLERFKSETLFIEKYFKMLERIKPKETIVKLLGPFSLAKKISNIECAEILTNKIYRKYLIEMLSVKALWFIYKIKEVSPNTRPIILFEEPLLNRFGSEKRGNEDIDSETLVSIYSRIFEKLHANSAYVGVQCLKKCDWQMPIDAGVDLISFNAYTNPHNLHIIAPKLWSFLQNGGYINWGIVPADGVDSVKGTNCETVLNDYNEILNSFIIRGFEEDVISKKSLVSPQNDVSKLPMIFADTALLNAYNLSSAIENQQQ